MQKRFSVFIATVLVSVMWACGEKRADAIPIERYDTPLWTASGDIVNIGGIRVLSDGRVIVADISQKELWLISADGKHIGSIGQHGSGPTEFKSVRNLLPLPGDSTLVLDDDQRRLLILDPNGNAVRTAMISAKIPQMAIGMISARTDERGRIVLPSAIMLMNADKDVPLLRWDWNSDRLDTIARVAVTASHMVKSNKSMSIYMVLFTPNDWFQPLANGETAIIRAADYRLEWADSLGHIRRGDTIGYKRVAVADTERNDAADPSFRDRIPSVKPPFNGHYAVASPEGELWVQRLSAFNADSTDYDIISANGKRIRIVRLKKTSRVRAVTSKRVYISYYNADDFELLQAFARK